MTADERTRLVVGPNPKVLWLGGVIELVGLGLIYWGRPSMPWFDRLMTFGLFFVIWAYFLTRRLVFADGKLTCSYYGWPEWRIDPRQARVSVRNCGAYEEWDLELPSGRVVSLRPRLYDPVKFRVLLEVLKKAGA